MSPSRFFQGKNVVVTGGSSGIGRALAVALAGLGANLLLVARRQDLLDETVAEINVSQLHASQLAETRAIDVGDRPAIQSALRAFDQKHPIDVLINCAGITCAEYIDRTPADVFEQIIETNYLGTVWTSLALIPSFKQRQRGTIANVASMAGVLGFLGYAAYAPSKFAVIGFSEAIRNELLPDNIRVHLLLPPDTDTPQLEAENRTRPVETRAIAGLSRVLLADDVARVFLRGIATGRFCIVPGWDANLSYRAARHFPALTRWVLDRVVASQRYKHV
jgi:3-dehydrosphinganine reductase